MDISSGGRIPSGGGEKKKLELPSCYGVGLEMNLKCLPYVKTEIDQMKGESNYKTQ